MPEIIYEREGDEVRMYQDCGVVDKEGRINELNASIVEKNREKDRLTDEIAAAEVEITALEEL